MKIVAVILGLGLLYAVVRGAQILYWLWKGAAIQGRVDQEGGPGSH